MERGPGTVRLPEPGQDVSEPRGQWLEQAVVTPGRRGRTRSGAVRDPR